MKCPQCGQPYACPCKNCANGHSKGKVIWIQYDDDSEECPKCGLRKHIDGWFDEELKQLKQEGLL
jgi:hypothetical protein